ncbi:MULTISPECIES: sensor histidine kinase [unclassified Paenibacillus]|uniref:cache domain-containing sensor histidine kinase n=1 Tax=unclassified Paenibacillus TaxID=185978 RepID=UPI0007BF54A1|nr:MULTISPECIES: sensor histidine kinase [unclassified Paenibacillus]SDK55513.1 two-component system, sensor histidine kinase YesM [Paenibacillus sp. OK060]
MKTLLSRFTLNQKMIVAFIGVALLSVLVMNFLSNLYYGRATEKDFYNIAEGTTVSLNHQLDIYFQQMAKSTYTMIAGPLRYTSPLSDNEDSGLIQEWLRSSDLSTEKQRVIKDILNKYISFNYPEIDNMYLMSLDDRVLQAQGNTSKDVVETQPWYGLDFTEHLQLQPTFYVKGTSYPVLSLIIPIYDVENVGLAGKLIINMRLSEIEEIIGKMRIGQTGYMFIVSEDNSVVYHSDSSYLSLPIEKTGLEGLSLGHKNEIQNWNGEKYLHSYSVSELTGWKTVAIVPLDEMASGQQIARNSAIIAMAVLALLIFVTVPILATRFVKPITQLKAAMDKVQKGDLTVQTNVKPGRDEIQLLNLSFNRMTKRLDELVKTVTQMEIKEVELQLMQKEAVIRALQNQINPHLLYNTLDIIKSIAFLEGSSRVERMADNLASLYRYTARFDQTEVSLSEELEQLSKYLDIIHVRYSKHFESKLYVDSKYLGIRIVKLTLQPIVENAVKYAVEPRNGKAAVIVSAYPDKGDLIIEIVDNGQGIEEELLSKLQQELADITYSTGNNISKKDSLGLVNIHNRLVLVYGKGYGVHLSSFPGKGTVVSIRLPFG